MKKNNEEIYRELKLSNQLIDICKNEGLNPAETISTMIDVIVGIVSSLSPNNLSLEQGFQCLRDDLENAIECSRKYPN